MKVPSKIKKLIYQQAKAAAKAYKYNKLLEPWLLKKKILPSTNLDYDYGLTDEYIDRVQYSGCDPDGFIKELEAFPEVEEEEE